MPRQGFRGFQGFHWLRGLLHGIAVGWQGGLDGLVASVPRHSRVPNSGGFGKFEFSGEWWVGAAAPPLDI